ncbi:unnamed protein product [Caenorhabditis sp. 36 PRJEB53466]|nr:unnamed protein product [Caenorhabditis sp. 36 PRJEB53466]
MLLFESILFGSIFLLTTVWIGCGKKKSAPTVAPRGTPPAAKSPLSTQSPVSKSPAKEKKEGSEKEKEKSKEKEEEGEEEKMKTKKKTSKSGEKEEEEAKKEEEAEKKEEGEKKTSTSNEKEDEKKEEKKEEEEDKQKEEEGAKAKTKEEQIAASPTILTFDATTTSQKKLRLKNLTDKKLMFKIKSSTTNIYLINPVFGKIEPFNFADVMVTHKPSAKGDHKLVIITSEFIGKEIEMAKTFKHIKTSGAEVSVKLEAK